jgi:hypothetical protein
VYRRPWVKANFNLNNNRLTFSQEQNRLRYRYSAMLSSIIKSRLAWFYEGDICWFLLCDTIPVEGEVIPPLLINSRMASDIRKH